LSIVVLMIMVDLKLHTVDEVREELKVSLRNGEYSQIVRDSMITSKRLRRKKKGEMATTRAKMERLSGRELRPLSASHLN